jgi:hypothetical protein
MFDWLRRLLGLKREGTRSLPPVSHIRLRELAPDANIVYRRPGEPDTSFYNRVNLMRKG